MIIIFHGHKNRSAVKVNLSVLHGMFWKLFEVVLTTPIFLERYIWKTSYRHPEDFLKEPWNIIEDVLKKSWRRVNKTSLPSVVHFEDVFSKSLEDVFLKTYWECGQGGIYLTDQNDYNPREDFFPKTNICWWDSKKCKAWYWKIFFKLQYVTIVFEQTIDNVKKTWR